MAAMSLVYTPGWNWSFEWAVYAGFVVAFLLAFGMGANDCANSYGTVVGARVLRLWQAYVLATIFEMLGAGLLGYRVTETMRKQIVSLDIYDLHALQNGTLVDTCSAAPDAITPVPIENQPCYDYTSADFILGELAALTGTAVWLILATVVHMPVSSTHSAVGATVGFSLVLRGANGITWLQLGKIVISWVASPLLAGVFSSIIYLIIRFGIYKKKDPFEAALKAMPFFYWFTISVNLFSVLYEGSKYLQLTNLPWWGALIVSVGIGFLVALFFWIKGTALVRKSATAMAEKESVEANNNIGMAIEESQTQNKLILKRLKLHFMGYGTPIGEPTNATPLESIESIKSISVVVEDRKKSAEVVTDVVDTAIVARVDPPAATTEYPNAQNPFIKTRQKLVAIFKTQVIEEAKTVKVFHFLQILSACFLSFSHGSNDTANAVGPLIGLWLTYKQGLAKVDEDEGLTIELIILFGGASMIVGLWILGHKVIQTIGSDITEINATSGFSVELGSAFTVLVASKIGIPISTTHCMVGAVVAVGWLRSQSSGVSWSTFRNICFAWLVTIPVSGGLAALVAYLLVHFILGTI